MKSNIMIAMLSLLAAAPAMSQQKAKAKPKEEVVIKQKGANEEKTTIIIDGDRITVNGKPLAEYDGDDIVIRKRELNEMIEREMREHQKEMAYAQRDMQRDWQRAQADMKRAMDEAQRSYPRGYDYNYNYNYSDKPKKVRISSEPKAFLGIGLEKADKGVMITDVSEGSAAAKAGLKTGDKITKFGSTTVTSPEQLTELVKARKPNDEVELTYIKAKETKEKKVKVKLGETASKTVYYNSDEAPRPPAPPRAPRAPKAQLYNDGGDWEFHMSPMPPMAPMTPMAPMEGFRWNYSNKPELGLRIQDMDDSSGVKVLDVVEGSLAATAGIKENDVITSINGKVVKETGDARSALRDAEDKYNYTLKILRGGSSMNIEIKVPKKLQKADL